MHLFIDLLIHLFIDSFVIYLSIVKLFKLGLVPIAVGHLQGPAVKASAWGEYGPGLAPGPGQTSD